MTGNNKTALVTGSTGQDGPYLMEHLARTGEYSRILAVVRPGSRRGLSSPIDHSPLAAHLRSGLIKVVAMDLTQTREIERLIAQEQPDELYNLAAQSHVGLSWEMRRYTYDMDLTLVLEILDAIDSYSRETRFYQAGSSEQFGDGWKLLQPDADGNIFLNETSTMRPQSPYAIAKTAAYFAVRNYRERAKNPLFACAGILFNHESERRPYDADSGFVTGKVAHAAARYLAWKEKGQRGPAPTVSLGTLDARRDWGAAQDYVCAMHGMLQQDHPDDYVVATGKTRSVRQLVETAFGLSCEAFRWEGSGDNEVGLANDNIVVHIDPKYNRPNELTYLLGDSTKAREILGWKPTISFEKMLEAMVAHHRATTV